ncbi:MAG: histidine phosphatase family protein [Candidatus Pacebacteria bacterium]|jgi:broad specificity phosphatase PhoE|nr:histidine phosphatase family protein [Candidatus Paceibacterota bacterium]MDD4994707.1 histidine phosphatase family protein [Candidatus Paceibacterota bacterium]MDD5535311.1 histidine phosphatase family protein [Candidatus Paceibacterota bacterium]
MKLTLKNRYFLLRHGKTIHQTEKKNITYFYPDDNPPCVLLKEGIEEVRLAGEKLKDKNIDLIFASDILRIKQTVEIVAKMIGYNLDKVVYDKRLRDINWGILSGKSKEEAWAYYNNDKMKKFDLGAPGGESWSQCQKRMIAVINEIEKNYEDKNVLIVSHGDPLWLLEGYLKSKSKEELIDIMNNDQDIKTGELKEINN